jgi:hypothetical protein
MKKLSHLLVASFGILMISVSCSKDEQPRLENSVSKLKRYLLTVPLSDGRTAVEMEANDEALKLTRHPDVMHNSYREITILDLDYVKSTKLIDISKLPLNTVYDSIGDKNLQLKFVGGLLKMAGYPNGWTAHWNVLPFTECEDPPVLYTQQQNHITIFLSKYCERFGFELAPNLTRTFEFSAGFYTSQENSPVANVTQMVTTPSGARLFAVESKKPFNVIEIQFTGSGIGQDHPYGFAIANIRYKLCK